MRIFRKFNYAICISFFLIITSCDTKEISPLVVSKELKINKFVTIADGCFSEPFIYDSFLILMTTCDSNFFQVYNKNTLELVGKFGNKGKSPHEFFLPLPYKTNTTNNLTDSILHFYDLNLVREIKINFHKITSGLKPFECITSQILDKKLSFSNDLSFLEGDKIAGRGISESEGLFFIYDKKLDKKKWVDYLPKKDINSKYRLMAYYGNLCSNNKNIVYAARFFDEILFYNSNGELLKEHYFSKVKKPVLSKSFSGVSDESMLYNMKAYGTPEFCYVLRIARTSSDFLKSRNEPSQILAFDWNGNLIDVYQHESSPLGFCVDEAERIMYCITRGNDPNNIRIEKIQL